MRRLVSLLLAIPLLGTMGPPAVAQAPTTAEESLAGMVTEEVEPGVFRVIDDGRRDLKRAYSVQVGMDGSVWGIRDGGFFRLGGTFTRWPRDSIGYRFAVSREGTIWASTFDSTLDDPTKGKDVIRTFDGQRWRTRKSFPFDSLGGAELAHDGTVWGWWPDPKDTGRWPATVVARDGADGWQRLGDPIPHVLGLRAGSGDDVWVMYEGDDGQGYLRQFVGGDWIEHEVPVSPDEWDVGAEGTVWAKRPWGGGDAAVEDHQDLIGRFDGDTWTEFGPEDGVPGDSVMAGLEGLRAAPDGSVWGIRDGWAEEATEEAGAVYHFDGTTWEPYLRGLVVQSMEVGPDGAVWLLGSDEGKPYALYVIVPTGGALKSALPLPPS